MNLRQMAIDVGLKAYVNDDGDKLIIPAHDYENYSCCRDMIARLSAKLKPNDCLAISRIAHANGTKTLVYCVECLHNLVKNQNVRDMGYDEVRRLFLGRELEVQLTDDFTYEYMYNLNSDYKEYEEQINNALKAGLLQIEIDEKDGEGFNQTCFIVPKGTKCLVTLTPDNGVIFKLGDSILEMETIALDYLEAIIV